METRKVLFEMVFTYLELSELGKKELYGMETDTSRKTSRKRKGSE
jgi:hypothetical protein